MALSLLVISLMRTILQLLLFLLVFLSFSNGAIAGEPPRDASKENCEDIIQQAMAGLDQLSAGYINEGPRDQIVELDPNATSVHIQGQYGGFRLAVRNPAGRKLFSIMNLLLGDRAARFFGFEFKEDIGMFIVPDSVELNGAIQKLNQLAAKKGIPSLKIRFHQTSIPFERNDLFLKSTLKDGNWHIQLPEFGSYSLHFANRVVPSIFIPTVILDSYYRTVLLEARFRDWLDSHFKWKNKKGVSQNVRDLEEHLANQISFNMGRGFLLGVDLDEMKRFQPTTYTSSLLQMTENLDSRLRYIRSLSSRGGYRTFDAEFMFDDSKTGALIYRYPGQPAEVVDDIFVIYRHMYYQRLKERELKDSTNLLELIDPNHSGIDKMLSIMTLQRVEQIRSLAEELSDSP